MPNLLGNHTQFSLGFSRKRCQLFVSWYGRAGWCGSGRALMRVGGLASDGADFGLLFGKARCVQFELSTVRLPMLLR